MLTVHRFTGQLLCSVVMACAAAAQQRLPVPDATAIEAQRAALLQELAALAEPQAADRLIRRACTDDLTPALRYALLAHAAECSRATGDLDAGLRVAEAQATHFAVRAAVARAACLQQFEGKPGVAAQTLAAAWLGEAAAYLESDQDSDFANSLAGAERCASMDSPPGLRALVTACVDDLRATKAAWLGVAAKPEEPLERARYQAFYRGQWQAALPELQRGGDGTARAARAKVDAAPARAKAAGEPAAPLAWMERLHAAEHWLLQSKREPSAVAVWHLRRRALALLSSLARAAIPLTHVTELEVPAAEQLRLLDLIFTTTDHLLAQGQLGSSVIRFNVPDDLAQMLTSEGAWRVENGVLLGRSTGPSTRATSRFAWRRLDSVVVRGGIRSAEGLNFRMAVGDCNVLLNWEVREENHVYFGEFQNGSSGRALTAGREHVIRLQQLDDMVVLFVDEQRIACGPGRLAGTISVYPALGSEIFVRSIEVVGDVDLATVVTGPSGFTR